MNNNPLVSSPVIIFLLFLGSVLLFFGGPGMHATRSFENFWDLGHIGFFALLVILLLKIEILKKLRPLYLWAGFIILTLVLGVAIEILQDGSDRTADLADVARDLTGCLLVLSFHPVLLNQTSLKASSHLLTVFTRVAAVVVLLVNLLPLSIALIDEATARSQFPVLSNFNSPFELDRWDGNATKKVTQLNPEINSRQIKIGLNTALYSGVGLNYFPSDWRGFSTLHIRLFQPLDEALEITLRIHDLEHAMGHHGYHYNDRFNRVLTLSKGWNEIEIALSEVEKIPANRKMDLSQIRGVNLFAISLAQPRTIYLDKIYLAN